VKFVLQVLFPIGLIFGPRLLVGMPVTLIAVGLASGFAMVALPILSSGIEKALSGGKTAARFYLWMALGSVVLAAVISLFVSGQLDALASRPGIQASVFMMPWVFWGCTVAFALVAAVMVGRKRSA
jgi:hypothetical protein